MVAAAAITGCTCKKADPRQALTEATEAYRKGQLDDAQQKIQAVLKEKPEDPLALLLFGQVTGSRWLKSRDPADVIHAEEALHKAIELQPDLWPAFQSLGELAEAQGHLQDAADAYEEVIAAQPNHPQRRR